MDTATLIDAVLNTTGKGDELMREWGDLPTLAQNLDAAGLTARQRKTLESSFKLQWAVRDGGDSVNSPADAAGYFQDISCEPVEKLVVLVLNTRNRVMAKEVIYSGSVNSSQVRIAEVLRPAVIRRASSIIIGHNHPSGDPTPSPDDVMVTRAIVEAGKLFDIGVLDHVIVANDKHVSLKERGLGFS